MGNAFVKNKLKSEPTNKDEKLCIGNIEYASPIWYCTAPVHNRTINPDVRIAQEDAFKAQYKYTNVTAVERESSVQFNVNRTPVINSVIHVPGNKFVELPHFRDESKSSKPSTLAPAQPPRLVNTATPGLDYSLSRQQRLQNDPSVVSIRTNPFAQINSSRPISIRTPIEPSTNFPLISERDRSTRIKKKIVFSVPPSKNQSIICEADSKSTVTLTENHAYIAPPESILKQPAVMLATKNVMTNISSIGPKHLISNYSPVPVVLNSIRPIAEREPEIDHKTSDVDYKSPISRNNSKPDDRMPARIFTNNKFTTPTSKNTYKIENTRNANQRKPIAKLSHKQYMPTCQIRNLFNNSFKNLNSNSEDCHLTKLINKLKNKSNPLTESNYLDALLLFADIEDLQCEDEILVYNRKSEKIEYSDVTENYIIKVPNLNDSRPLISVSSRLTISSPLLKNCKPIDGTILEIQPTHILVDLKRKIDTDIQYDVNFLSNRTTFCMEKFAIELMRKKDLVPFMFPNSEKVNTKTVHQTGHQFTWFNKSVAKNLEQQIVIENIFNGMSYPYPYILFGPPGTGKTTTLVESILQLWKNKIETRILVVSTSNFACNVISKRLLEFLDKTDVYRLFSKSQEVAVDKIDTHILKVSNLESKIHYNPKPSELYPYRIIVATLTTSGRLIQNGFDNSHFTHLFIDECGSCTEGSSLIPIAGLISSRNVIKANIVLAGDPLQLGPMIYSKYAENLGYGISLIARLMELPLYKKDEQSGGYNTKFITKLRFNYRSHKDILCIPNRLFYNNELKALAPKEVAERLINWIYLPNRKFPMLFHAVFGESLQENNSPSLYNKHEINVVMSYLYKLVNKSINGKVVQQADVGVVTPYRKQNQKIRTQCDSRKWNEVEVGSVEAFQGNEKSIIIFSTVRSNVDTMGFLSSERRLNVALTRAQTCLIIIGNPKVLMKDRCWYQLMKYCYDNKAICGESFDFYD